MSRHKKKKSRTGDESTLKKAVVGAVVLLVPAVGGLVGFAAWLAERDARAAFLDEFRERTNVYVELGKSSFIDVVERGHTDDNQSENMKEFRSVWPEFQSLLEQASAECPTEAVSISELRCANTKFFSVYDALEEKQELSIEMDRIRFAADCGSDAWVTLDKPFHELEREGRALHDLLRETRASAIRSIASCADVSFIAHGRQQILELFGH